MTLVDWLAVLSLLVDAVGVANPLILSGSVLIGHRFEHALTVLDLVIEGTKLIVLKPPDTAHLFHQQLTIAPDSDLSTGVLGRQVEGFDQRLVLRLVVRAMPDAF